MSPEPVAPGGADAQTEAVAAKAGFDHVYNRPDPREYFKVLGGLGYAEPAHCHRIASALLPHIQPRRARPTVFDLGCSYGTLGALLQTDRTLEDLQDRYRDHSTAELAAEGLAAADRDYLRAHQRVDRPVVAGLDAADAAVRYALATGALDHGWVADLERSEPSADLRSGLQQVDLIAVAGAVGYLTETTFRRLLDTIEGQAPWIAALVVRMYPYDRIAEALAERGLVTERLEGVTFPRRRFASAEEQARVLAQLDTLGIDPTGREAEGWYHAALYLSRPAAESAPPVSELLRFGDLGRAGRRNAPQRWPGTGVWRSGAGAARSVSTVLVRCGGCGDPGLARRAESPQPRGWLRVNTNRQLTAPAPPGVRGPRGGG